MENNKPHFLIAGRHLQTGEIVHRIYNFDPADSQLKETFPGYVLSVYRFSSKQDALVGERAVLDWVVLSNIIRRIG